MREVIDVMPRLVDGDERAAADVVEMTWHAARALSAASALFPRPDGFGRVDGARWWHDAFLETRDRFAERAPSLPPQRSAVMLLVACWSARIVSAVASVAELPAPR